MMQCIDDAISQGHHRGLIMMQYIDDAISQGHHRGFQYCINSMN